MKIYISSHNMDVSIAIAQECRDAGHEVVSTWHSGTWGESTAERNVEEIKSCDALLLTATSKYTAGGKFFEAGVAYALGKPVYSLAGCENFYMKNLATHINNVSEIK